MKNLVIVESPSKCKTISKYLGDSYKVVSSKGHIRDLATTGKYGLGVDLENNFKPNYIPIKGKKKLITELKKDVKSADLVYLATDPDREGEAISWHLKEELNIKDHQYKRAVFNEITKDKIIAAINHPTMIDDDLVKSQETRRILDRIIGFRLSKLMQSKTEGKSAGRVQSVALKLIVDREREIEAFVSTEYWSITAKFSEFEADLYAYNNKDIEIKTEEEAKEILGLLSNAFKIDDVSQKAKSKKSKPPFTTSTLQQEASTKLNFNAKKTMSLAQKLYEGIDIGNETVGLISYMRTDSIRLSDEFIKSTYAYIADKHGKEYIGHAKEMKKKDNIQDAHEGIRPTSINRTPDTMKAYLTIDEYKLYKMIYIRALASLMVDAKVLSTTIKLDNNNYQFKATGSILTFDGYLKVYKEYEDSEEKILPPLENYNSKIVLANTITPDQHFTKPLPRYTEARLIKEMEELGIGRPSTYAKTIDILKERMYVNIADKKFVPTEVGIEITDKLQEFFSNIINVEYTANMENDLDLIADGEKEWHCIVQDFYDIFEPNVKKAFSDMEKKAPKETGELCPECQSPLVIRKGKFGYFTACSNYPTCKYIKKDKKEVDYICDCPKCHDKIIEKKTKRGKVFYGCHGYPKCDFALWDKPTGELCPECHSLLTSKGNFIKCSNCDYEKSK